MIFLNNFLLDKKNVVRDSYIWNLVASLLFGFQSVMILVVLTRTVELNDSGIFTIAYANASLFLLVGKYGVRNYQVSDVKQQHAFKDYQAARVISVLAMCMFAFIYVAYSAYQNDYSLFKSTIIIWTCLYKVPDAIEDVYFGEYQRQGRLDVAARAMTIRLLVSIMSLILMVIITRNLLISLIVSTVLSLMVVVLLIKWTIGGFEVTNTLEWKSVGGILANCFPLFMGTFLAQYINNAPKYAIDSQLSDDLQACYGFIAMPVFVISLLNNVIFSPVIHSMADYWNRGEIRKFIGRFLKQIFIVLGITAVSIGGAWLIGIPVLSMLYNIDLSHYKIELLILLLGGGFSAASGLLNTMVTIMRFQHTLLWGYLAITVLAMVVSPKMVSAMGITGASWSYTILMAILFIIFLVIFMVGMIRRIREK